MYPTMPTQKIASTRPVGMSVQVNSSARLASDTLRNLRGGQGRHLLPVNAEHAISDGYLAAAMRWAVREHGLNAHTSVQRVADIRVHGNRAVESLVQILEYFPDKLTVNQLSAEQLRFVKSALSSTTKSIDDFLLLMPEDDVTAAKRQVDDDKAVPEAPMGYEETDGPEASHQV